MTTTARILKADPRSISARRFHLSDLSMPVSAPLDSADFEPLMLPINCLTATPTACAQRVVNRENADAHDPATDPRVESALAALQTTADQLHLQRDHWLDQSQHQAVRLGVAIAERLLRRTLVVQPEAVLDLIRSALDWSVGADRLRVRLHPADIEIVTAASAAEPLATNREIEFLSDDSLARGDCLVETPNGQTDARLDVILQRIADELLAE
ncbi:MAG: FliH/SctL family protein [Planctomycetaceae bacterium]